MLKIVTPVAGEQREDWVINNHVDHSGPGTARDFRGNPVTYDGHNGTDFDIFSYEQMERGVSVRAAAPGKVIRAVDTHSDRNFAQGFDQLDEELFDENNVVVLDHGNGYRTYYSHLKQGSVDVKAGERVAQGEEIGLVGSSGFSTNPHLDFMLAREGEIIDPFSFSEIDWMDKPAYALDGPHPSRVLTVPKSSVNAFEGDWFLRLGRSDDQDLFSAGAKPTFVVKGGGFRQSETLSVRAETAEGQEVVSSDFDFSINGSFVSYLTVESPDGARGIVVEGSHSPTSHFADAVAIPRSGQQAPVASPDFVIVSSSNVANVDVLQNDVDPESDELRIEDPGEPENGEVSVMDNRDIRYSVDDGFTGTDTFTYTVSDGNGGTDTGQVKVSVEQFAFFDLPAVDQVTAVYVGYFGRAPDSKGRDFWVTDLTQDVSQGQSPAATAEEMASGFRFSEEAQSIFPFLDPTVSQESSQAQIQGFVENVFGNLFNRTLDEAGAEFWVGEIEDRLDSGQNIGDVIIDVMAGATESDVSTLQNKIEVANAYTDDVSQLEVEESVQIIGTVDNTQDSVEQALGRIG